ncbi:MAG: hypothetical protein WCW17_03180, partial [Patescibacteria group bacterium]
MSRRSRLTISIVSSIFFFAFAIILWGYQTGRISFFASSQTETQHVSSFSNGQPDSNIDLALNRIQLKDQAGGYIDKGSYISEKIGGTNVGNFSNFTPTTEVKINMLKNPGFETAGTGGRIFSDWKVLADANINDANVGDPDTINSE